MESLAWSSVVFAAAFVVGGEAGQAIENGAVSFEQLFQYVNGAIIIAIMGITTILRQVGGRASSRWIPLVPMLLGAACGWLVADDNMSLRQIITWSLLYSGAASVGYMFVWKTIIAKGLKDEE